MTLVILGAALLVASYVGIEGVRRYALRHRVLDIPNVRSSHSVPTPRGGGLVIVAATLLSLAVAAVLQPTPVSRASLAYAVGGILVATVGWLDDLRDLPTGARFLAHLGAGALLLSATGWWETAMLPMAGPTALGWLAVPLALLWIVGMTNAYNFMDGIDGIAAGQAVAAGLVWVALASAASAIDAAAVAIGLTLSSAAFLAHNWAPARIFMGDAGSGFLGFTFAAMPFLMLDAAMESPLGQRLPVVAALLVWPFVFDTLFTLCRRAWRGEPVLRAHRSHLYQRLVLAGSSHRSVATLYIGLATGGALLAAGWLTGVREADLAVLSGVALLALTLVALVVSSERRKIPLPANHHGDTA
jgi:UDP-N-acetylmuramyl pentapeptide phosphotransferase/UDP-N-acetylglucosamine-1-phosphate transferase